MYDDLSNRTDDRTGARMRFVSRFRFQVSSWSAVDSIPNWSVIVAARTCTVTCQCTLNNLTRLASAVGTGAMQHEVVILDQKSISLLDERDHPLHGIVPDFLLLPAHPADEMVMLLWPPPSNQGIHPIFCSPCAMTDRAARFRSCLGSALFVCRFVVRWIASDEPNRAIPRRTLMSLRLAREAIIVLADELVQFTVQLLGNRAFGHEEYR
jgi:hypothetical protein